MECTVKFAHRHSRTGAIARHGRRPGSRTVMRKARAASQFRRMGFQREGRLCAKPFPLACLSSDSFRTSGKNRPPEGRTSRRIPPGSPGRPAAPAPENDAHRNPRLFRGTVKTVPYGCVIEYARRHFRTGAIARHGRRPGTRTVMGKARAARRFRRMGFQREGRLCKQ